MMDTQPDYNEKLHPDHDDYLPENLSLPLRSGISDAKTAIRLAQLVRKSLYGIENARNVRLYSQVTRLDAYEARQVNKFLRESGRKIQGHASNIRKTSKSKRDATKRNNAYSGRLEHSGILYDNTNSHVFLSGGERNKDDRS